VEGQGGAESLHGAIISPARREVKWNSAVRERAGLPGQAMGTMELWRERHQGAGFSRSSQAMWRMTMPFTM
jgi:hypothetical protein